MMRKFTDFLRKNGEAGSDKFCRASILVYFCERNHMQCMILAHKCSGIGCDFALKQTAMDTKTIKELEKDTDGLMTYEYIANNIGVIDEELDWLTDNLIRVDGNGQFLVSAARYLNAVDKERFAGTIDRMVSAAIDRDRERAYIGHLLQSLYGDDYLERAEELRLSDNNFRRIYKRLYPKGI